MCTCGVLSVASCLVTRPLRLTLASWAFSASKRVRALARSIPVVFPRHPASSSPSQEEHPHFVLARRRVNHRQTVHSCAVMAQPSLDTFNPAVSVPLKAHRSADVATGVVRPDLPRNFPRPGWRSWRALRQAWPCGAQGEKDGAAPVDAVKHTAKYGKARAQAAGLRYECNTTPGCQEQVRAGKWGKGGPSSLGDRDRRQGLGRKARIVAVLKPTPFPQAAATGLARSWQPTRVDRPMAAFMEHSVPLPL